ncbi:MAG: hypothetical protein QXP68_04245 [Thermosphaera sp.]
MMVKKRRVTVHIREDLWEEFKRLAYAKNPDFYGALSHEVEQALQAWLAQHTQKHAGRLIVNKQNPQPKVYETFLQVKEYLKNTYGYGAIVPGQQIPRRHLIDAISAIRGTDKRTIRKWMDLFVKYKLIKWIAGEIFEVV